MIYASEKALSDGGDKIPSEVKDSVKGKIDALKSTLSGTDREAIERAAKELSDEIQKVGAAMYDQGGAADSGSQTKESEGEQESGSEQTQE